MKLVFISDTHNKHEQINVPPCDVVCHCGDSTMHGDLSEYLVFAKWFARLEAKHKVLIPGNHDFCLQEMLDICKEETNGYGIHLLLDSGIVLDGVSFWGTPWVPNLVNWAFYGPRDQLLNKFSLVPNGVNVLLSHGPPRGMMDNVRLQNVGSEEMREMTNEVKPKIHAFGHIHEGTGMRRMEDGRVFINCSSLDERYNVRPENNYYEVTL